MSVTSAWLSRRLGYGFAYDEELPSPEKWIEDARNQVGKLPKFDPWRLIAKNPQAKNIKDLDLPDLPFINSAPLTKNDLNYPTNIKRSAMQWSIGNSERERLRALLASKKITEGELDRLWWIRYNRFPWWRDTVTRGIDNVFGTSPVFNRFWHFWINHFSLNVENCEGELFGNYYLSLRSNLTQTFEKLLFDAIWHPAMQVFLDNKSSRGPNSKTAVYERSIGKTPEFNENLARELLELYTVTPKSNFTQKDVDATTFILSGWGAWDWNNPNITTNFFLEEKAEPGTHLVMGKSYGGFDLESGLKNLCGDLSRHPFTANHIANKLAIHFISDVPPKESVQRISKVFQSSNGSLVKVHQAVIDEVVAAGSSYKKFTAPELWFWQVYRAAKLMPPLFSQGFTNILYLDDVLLELGQLHSRAPQPNGWSDLDSEWITPEYLDRRIRYSQKVAWSLSRDEKFNPKEYVARLPRIDEDTINSVRRSESYKTACNILFCSRQFLEV